MPLLTIGNKPAPEFELFEYLIGYQIQVAARSRARNIQLVSRLRARGSRIGAVDGPCVFPCRIVVIDQRAIDDQMLEMLLESRIWLPRERRELDCVILKREILMRVFEDFSNLLAVLVDGFAVEPQAVADDGLGVVFSVQRSIALIGKVDLHEQLGQVVQLFCARQKGGYGFVVEERLQAHRLYLAPASAKCEIERQQHGAFSGLIVADEDVQLVVEFKFETLEPLEVR